MVILLREGISISQHPFLESWILHLTMVPRIGWPERVDRIGSYVLS